MNTKIESGANMRVEQAVTKVMTTMTTMVAVSMTVMTLVAGGCTEGTASSAPPKSPAAAAILQAPIPTACPLGVQGARVSFEETERGGTLTFLAPSNRTDEMRERARDASALHGPNQKVGKGHEGKHGMGGDHGLQVMQLPAAYAAEDDIEGGARIRLTAIEDKDIAELQSKLRGRVQAMLANCD